MANVIPQNVQNNSLTQNDEAVAAGTSTRERSEGGRRTANQVRSNISFEINPDQCFSTFAFLRITQVTQIFASNYSFIFGGCFYLMALFSNFFLIQISIFSVSETYLMIYPK